MKATQQAQTTVRFTQNQERWYEKNHTSTYKGAAKAVAAWPNIHRAVENMLENELADIAQELKEAVQTVDWSNDTVLPVVLTNRLELMGAKKTSDFVKNIDDLIIIAIIEYYR
jgi:hypothetical protein